MKCLFIDHRVGFFGIVEQKLGSPIQMVAIDPCDLIDGNALAGASVLIISLPAACGVEDPQALLQRAVLNRASLPVIVWLREHNRDLIRQAISCGAYDYFIESESMDELQVVLRRAAHFFEIQQELEKLKSHDVVVRAFGGVVAAHPAMVSVCRFGARIAATDATVLITGETGTGKEVLARAIHENSQRANQPFVAVACASLPETLIEAELFGHEKGAFTGAATARVGRFEAAGRGTIFLDEIGELTPGLQVKLLRVLQERKFEKLGSNVSRPMEARVLCATNRDLKALVREGQFRADLYYRLNTIEIEIPPLRDRPEDAILLAETFLQRHSAPGSSVPVRISAAVSTAFRRYPWPGNVRELEHVIERAVVLCDGPEIRLEHLPTDIVRWNTGMAVKDETLDGEVRSFKRRLIIRKLNQANNNKTEAARQLGISRSSLHRLLEELAIADNAVPPKMAS